MLGNFFWKIKVNREFRWKVVRYSITIFLILFAVYLFVPYKAPTTMRIGKYAENVKSGVLYHIDRIMDGDTFTIDLSGHEVTLRLIGMDTPEVVDPRKPVQCYGPEASAHGKELLAGKEVYIETEPGRESYDKYGRILAYARLPDGTLYNQKMIEEGYAHEYTFNHEKYKYQKEFKSAEKKAQKAGLGLWTACKN